MRRVFQTVLVASVLCAPLGLHAQRGAIQFHGTPASVTSPRVDGTFRGIPASVTDPTFVPSMSVHPSINGFRHGHRHFSTPVYVVPYYGYYSGYPYAYDASFYDQPQQPVQQQAPPPQVIIIKEERSSADEDRRYGENEFEEGQSNERPPARESAQSKPPAAPIPEEQLPMTTLVYRDGHKGELRNYAIVGSNLIDLTKSSLLKKIPLASLDLEATRRENEENGVDFHVP
jgi:hypothetical protein